MTVAINKRDPEESPFDQIVKGLNAARAVTGIAVDYTNLKKYFDDKSRQENNIVSTKEGLEYTKDYNVSDQEAPGAIKIGLQGPGGVTYKFYTPKKAAGSILTQLEFHKQVGEHGGQIVAPNTQGSILTSHQDAMGNTVQDWVKYPGKGADTPKDIRNVAIELRKERNGLPTTKDTQDVASAYQRMLKLKESAAGDMGLIYSFMKINDPGSTVREGEFANAQNAAGVPQKILNIYNRVRTGERLSPEQRADFLDQARQMHDGQMARQNQIDDQYRTLAKKYNIDPNDVIVNLSVPNSALVERERRSKKPGMSLIPNAMAGEKDKAPLPGMDALEAEMNRRKLKQNGPIKTQ